MLTVTSRVAPRVWCGGVRIFWKSRLRFPEEVEGERGGEGQYPTLRQNDVVCSKLLG